MDKASALMRACEYLVVMKRENCRKKQSSQFSKQFSSPSSPVVMSLG